MKEDEIEVHTVPGHPNFILKSPYGMQVQKLGEAANMKIVEVNGAIGDMDVETGDKCSDKNAKKDNVFTQTDVKDDNDNACEDTNAETKKTPERLNGSVSPKTPNLVYGNDPWKTDIPPTPDGLPLANRYKSPPSSKSHYLQEVVPTCASNITQDLILVSPERGMLDTPDRSQTDRPIVVTPIVETGPVTSIYIQR